MQGPMLLLMLGALAPAQTGGAAATTPPLVASLDSCRKLTDDAQRLACFDRAAAALVEATRSGQVSLVDKEQIRETRRSLFGFSLPRLPFFGGDKSVEEANELLQSTVKSARSIGYGKYQVTLTDGNAVWETTESYSTMSPPERGQKIEIKRGPLGSYLIRIDGQRGVKGRRIG